MGQTSGQPSVITHLVNQLRDAQAQQRIEDARGLPASNSSCNAARPACLGCEASSCTLCPGVYTADVLDTPSSAAYQHACGPQHSPVQRQNVSADRRACDDRGPKHASPVPESAAGSADAWLAWHAASLEGTGSRRTGAPAEKALLSGRRHCHKSASWMYWNIVRSSSVTWSQAAILSKTRYDTLFCCRALPCAYLRLCQLQPSRVLAQWHACTPSFG